MAMDKSTYDKLGEKEKLELAKKYADRLLYALTEEGELGAGIGTNEQEVTRIAKELQRIGHSDLVNLIDSEVRKKEPKGLRQVLISDYSGDAEDKILNAFGYATDDLYGQSLQESQTDDPGMSNFGKFGPGGTVGSNEYDESEAIVAEEGLGSGALDERDVASKSEGPDIRKPETLADLDLPAPAAGQAQAARPNLDQPDGATSAAARAAAQTMPDFVNRLDGNARFANRAKAQMMQEAKRRQQNEIADLKKSEKAKKRAGEVDEILNAKNDQYRQLYANSSEDRSVEDWDAMDRDQKIKMMRNYNINQSLGPAKTLENPDTSKAAQAKPAAVRPDGSPVSQTHFDQFFNNPEVPDFGNIKDKPPAGMAPVYGPGGKIGYRSLSETAEAAKNYAKNSMRNNARSTTGNVFSGDMKRLYPSLPVNRFKEEVDFDETEKQKKYNPFA